MNRTFLIAFIVLWSGLAAGAEDFPSRPVTIIAPASPGGPTDAIARVLAEKMRPALGQPVVVENVTGAAGNIATARVARAAADGYTIMMGLTSTHVFNSFLYSLPFDVVKDFEPVALVATNPQVIVSRPGVPATDLRALVSWLKASPGAATMATIGPGSPAHIAGILFQQITGTTFRFVPYRGGAPGMQDLLGGQIDLMIPQPSLALPQMTAGKIRAYAVTSSTRLPSAPDTPTVDEAGAPGLHIAIWHGLWAPKGTSADVVAKLNSAVRQALSDTDLRQRFAQMGQEIPPTDQQTPSALAEHQKAELENWGPIIKAADLRTD